MKYKKIKPRRTKFKDRKIIYIFLLFLFMGVGYAALTTSLSINGTTNVATNSWNIHFANLYVQSGSVESAAPTVSTNSISYSATLAQPGDFYEFSVDVKNDGTLPGKVSLVNLTGNSTNYLSTSFTYSNGDAISVGDIINAGKSKRLTIKAWIPSDIDTSLLPTQDTPITLTFNLQYTQSEEDLTPDATDGIIALAKNNSCIYKYEGDVTDKVGVTEEATQIYFNKCADKRNIIFGGFCWQMIRTTETGGIKMIYNGEAVDGKCTSTGRGHSGAVGRAGAEEELAGEYLYGESYTTDLDNSSFTLVDTTTATWSDSTYESLLGKYTCKNTSGTCTELHNVNGYMDNITAYTSKYLITDLDYAAVGRSTYNANGKSAAMAGYMFNKVYNYNSGSPISGSLTGNHVTYSNGVYTLLPADGESELGTTLDATHHYTCNTTSNTCSEVRYYSSETAYIVLKGTANIESAVNEMLFNDDVNKYNSSAKGMVDSWYKQFFLNKTNKLEDIVHCNDRNLVDLGGYNPNGGELGTSMNYTNYDDVANLTCLNETDQFAVGNNKAKLTYPVALATDVDTRYIDEANLLKAAYHWWKLSPYYFSGGRVFHTYMINSGQFGAMGVITPMSIRPVISLAPGNIIASGSGSESDPWIIQE